MSRRLPILAAGLVAAAAIAAPTAQAAAGPPEVLATWVTTVSPSAANLRAEINPHELATTYHFEYVTEADFLAGEFDGAIKVPAGPEAKIGIGSQPVSVVQHPGGLEPDTGYRFRVVAVNGEGTATGPTRSLRTDESAPVFSLPDHRGWEMVSPVDKNGGEIQNFGGNFGGGVIQASDAGGAITYTSTSSFAGPQGSPGASQYVATRGSGSWATQNITPPMISGSYPEAPTSGVPYQLFSEDLTLGLVSNGRRCWGTGVTGCPVENPPLPGSEAPAGYRNYYLLGPSGFQAVLTSTDLLNLELGPEYFEVAFAGATPDLSHIILSTCADMLSGQPVPAEECDPTKQQLYEKSGSELRLIAAPPGATLASQSRAISADGSRVYWTDGINLHLRDGSLGGKQPDSLVGGGGHFETASVDGSVAFFSKAGHLYRYEAGDGDVEDLTPVGGLEGVLGASDDGSYVYYQTTSGLFLEHAGTVTPIASSADEESYPPASGTARVSADGKSLVFVSSAPEVADYDNRNEKTGELEPEVYLFTAPGSPNAGLVCASCNPSGERPIGAAAIPGASRNGEGPYAPDTYKPRVLADSAHRVFFQTSDALVVQDTNKDFDVYQWESDGTGTCAREAGCVDLLSSGRGQGATTFLDASADGADAYFLTGASLVRSDPGVNDVYDARVGGGFPEEGAGIPCFGDACQPLPPEPEDPNPGTLRTKKSGNLPPPTPKQKLKCKKGQVKRFGKCKKKPQHHKKKGRR